MSDEMNGPSPEELYEAVCRATEQVFATMLNMEIVPGAPIFEHDFPGHFDGVVSFVGMAGAWLGTGGLSCDASFARRIAASFLMMDFPTVDDDVLDAIGELTNIIIGNVKGTIEQSVGPMALSTPTCIVGHDLTAHSLGRRRGTVISFRCGEDNARRDDAPGSTQSVRSRSGEPSPDAGGSIASLFAGRGWIVSVTQGSITLA